MLLGQHCFSPRPLQADPHSCSMACPFGQRWSLWSWEPGDTPQGDVCHSRGVGAASRACRAGGRWGMQEGLQGSLVVSLWWTHSPSAAALLLPIWPLGHLLFHWVCCWGSSHGFICSCWHFHLPLKCLLYWAFPVLKVFPKRPLFQEAPDNKHSSEGTGGFVFT